VNVTKPNIRSRVFFSYVHSDCMVKLDQLSHVIMSKYEEPMVTSNICSLPEGNGGPLPSGCKARLIKVEQDREVASVAVHRMTDEYDLYTARLAILHNVRTMGTTRHAVIELKIRGEG
jgi:hypothetical protein